MQTTFYKMTPADRFATVYSDATDSARPVGSISRPRIDGIGGTLWELHGMDGAPVAQYSHRPTRGMVGRALAAHAAPARPKYDMSQHDLAPVQSGGFPMWAMPVDHMRQHDSDSDWADINPRGAC